MFPNRRDLPNTNGDPFDPKGPKNLNGVTGGPMILPEGMRRNGGGTGGGMLSAFLPGQQAAISSQLAQGFGGSPAKWTRILGQSYSDMQMPKSTYGYRAPDKKGGKNGDGKGDDGKGGNGKGDDDESILNDSFHSHNEALPMEMAARQMQMNSAQLGQATPMQGRADPMIGHPQMGNMMPAQIMQLLRQRAMMGGR